VQRTDTPGPPPPARSRYADTDPSRPRRRLPAQRGTWVQAAEWVETTETRRGRALRPQAQPGGPRMIGGRWAR
jgi:hypothetical protein